MRVSTEGRERNEVLTVTYLLKGLTWYRGIRT